MKKITLLFLFLTYISFSQSLVKTYYDSFTKTKLKEVFQVKPNTPIVNGYYKSYDQYGYLLVHRNYINNKQNGESVTYYGANEASLMSDNIRSKCLGQISGIFNYKNDQLDGIQKRFDYSKEGIYYLQFKQIFKDGVEIESFEYYPNKNLKQHNNLNGISTGYYENGKKFEQFTLVNGKYQGQYSSWYESGKLLEQGLMVDDKKDGEWIEYNDDGTVKVKELYSLGKRIPNKEEKELAEQKRLEETKKEEEYRAEQEQKKLEIERVNQRAKELENEKAKAENEKNNLIVQIDKKKSQLDFENKNLENKYRVVDEIKSSILGEKVFKFKKKNLYNSYMVLTDYLQSELNTSNLKQKNDILDLGLSLVGKMNVLLDNDTSNLEKRLKKVDEPKEIIEILKSENL